MSVLGIPDIKEAVDADEDVFAGLKTLRTASPPIPTPNQLRGVGHLVDTRHQRNTPPEERVQKDSFTFRPEELVVLEQQVVRAMRMGQRRGKSAIVRAGLALLAGLDEEAFAQAIANVEEAKRGPRKR